MKNPHVAGEGADQTQQGAARTILADQHCPNMPLCRRWSADENGTFCRLCWPDFTDPKPLHVTEGRA